MGLVEVSFDRIGRVELRWDLLKSDTMELVEMSHNGTVVKQ